ncbi:MAG: hypothetical protein FP825_11635 [Hyphomonas sp.]|uniref:hypothetical protein n=1 Tax=Hyphomonas sp. TaxID=87 RepID=UPI00179B1F9D|nr:hypothetical protein [Hyphomonas sp.]MBA3069120.1 hypothetical protein [Hyphomonas sp.]MBU3919333.1 hypothetical protein [Alphaproteobacteria bacterium]MBU4061535.1 hypothetical protein [Alphaproteobacteria bacterium]MBU4165393.1 hypothetical protein [Alphaproteobacteria bacterium]
MTGKTRIVVEISDANAKKLQRLRTEQSARKGAIVDEALTLLFLPPIERPEAVLVQQIKRLEKKLDRLDAGAAFQADLLVEFIYAWLQQRPGPNPLRSPTDDARAGAELEALMKRVADRSNPFIWS